MVRFAIPALLLSLIALAGIRLASSFVPGQWIFYLIVLPGAVLAILITPPPRRGRPCHTQPEPVEERSADATTGDEAFSVEEELPEFNPATLRGAWKGTARLWPMDRRSTLSLFDVRLLFDPHSGTADALPVHTTRNANRLVRAEIRGIDWIGRRLDLELLVERNGEGNLHRYVTPLTWQPPGRGRPQPRLVAETVVSRPQQAEELRLELLPERSVATLT